MVKEYLSLKGFKFAESNVSVDTDARRQLLGLGFDTTPITVIGATVVQGFSPDELDRALEDIQD